MANITGTSQIAPGADVYYDRVLLERAQYELIFNQFGQTRDIPSKSTDSIKFRQYSNLAPAVTPLTEGVTPQGSSLSVSDIVSKVSQYGDFITITDKVEYIVEDSVLNEGIDILGQQMGETHDELARDVLASTASVFNCTNGTNSGTPTELNLVDINKVTTSLMSAKAKRFTPEVSASNKVGTNPIEAAFWVLAHTDISEDLRNVSGFKTTEMYGTSGGKHVAEFGAVSNTRWLLSPNGIVSSGVYGSMILGKNAYGSTSIREGISSMIYQEATDPLKQRSTQGWKSLESTVLLNENWLTKVNSTLGA